jgi:hypothetical protein
MVSKIVPEMTPPAASEALSDAGTAAGADTAGVSDSEQTTRSKTIGTKTNDRKILFDTHIYVCLFLSGDYRDPKSQTDQKDETP